MVVFGVALAFLVARVERREVTKASLMLARDLFLVPGMLMVV